MRSSKITTSKCHVPGCQHTIPSYMLMCLDHWKLVPSRIRLEVRAALEEGKSIRAHPTARYTIAARSAIETVQGKVAARAARIAADTRQPSLGCMR